MTITDGFIALLACVVMGLAILAGQPSEIVFGPQVAAEVPTVYADTKPYKRKP